MFTKSQLLQLENLGSHLRRAGENVELFVKSLQGGTTKTKAKAEEPAEEEEMEEVESKFKKKASKKTATKKAAPVEEEEEEETEEASDDFDFDDAEVEEETEEEEEPEHTEADVRTAMTAYAKKHSKEKALAVLGKFAKTKKVADVPPAKFGALITALKVK